MMNSLNIFAILSCFSTSAIAGSITLDVTEINGESGQVGVAIFSQNNAHGFPKSNNLASYGNFFNISELPVKIDLPSNMFYAATIFLDKNFDEKLNTKGILSIPSEPFGFSNNPRLLFGPPSFKSSKFYVGEDNTNLSIKLKRF
jgi:uncharacterized protein (DUF2141 family)